MYSAKETLTGQAGLDKIMPTSLQGISQKARKLREYRFRNLYRLLNEQALRQAWKQINKNAAAGVDKITAKDYLNNLEENLQQTLTSLKNKTYRTKLVRRVEIPKGEGKTGC